MPIAENGVIADIHVTAFQSSIDQLLSAARYADLHLSPPWPGPDELLRSENPSNVLGAMKTVVNAVSAVTDDVKAFEHNPTRFDVSEDTVRHLRERCDATLQNLVSAARNHAASFGLSAVSLMDAAASHVSAAIIDLVKLLYLRRTNFVDRDREARSPDYNQPSGSPYKPTLRTVEELRTKSPHARTASSGSGSSRMREEDHRERDRNMSGSITASNPINALSPQQTSQSFDDVTTMVGGASDDASTLAGGDNSWAELKVCSVSPLVTEPRR